MELNPRATGAEDCFVLKIQQGQGKHDKDLITV